MARFFEWLLKTPPEEPEEKRIEKIMVGLASSDLDLRGEAQRTFYYILENRNRSYPEGYIISVLNALGNQVGIKDIHWIMRHVEFLADPPMPAYFSEAVHKSAQSCLTKLRERYLPDYAATTLLHPASDPRTTDDLLRPANATPETHPETLLHPAEADLSKE